MTIQYKGKNMIVMDCLQVMANHLEDISERLSKIEEKQEKNLNLSINNSVWKENEKKAIEIIFTARDLLIEGSPSSALEKLSEGYNLWPPMAYNEIEGERKKNG